jgi:hypothetical protein
MKIALLSTITTSALFMIVTAFLFEISGEPWGIFIAFGTSFIISCLVSIITSQGFAESKRRKSVRTSYAFHFISTFISSSAFWLGIITIGIVTQKDLSYIGLIVEVFLSFLCLSLLSVSAMYGLVGRKTIETSIFAE